MSPHTYVCEYAGIHNTMIIIVVITTITTTTTTTTIIIIANTYEFTRSAITQTDKNCFSMCAHSSSASEEYALLARMLQ